MNKDVIYIEPEDDITDILSKLANSTEKVVALVPPKKAGVLRSAVNIKLIAKSAKSANKVAVLVTADPNLVKLAATARIPVAKTLQSRPEIPDETTLDEPDSEQIIEEDLSDAAAMETEQTPNKTSKSASANSEQGTTQGRGKNPTDDDLEASDDEKPSKKSQKSDKSDKSKKVPDIKKARKKIIVVAIAAVAVIGFLVWALVFAPAANLYVTVKTTANNFSENVDFTTTDAQADPSGGRFLLEGKEYKQESKVQFKATGSKDIGNHATGTLSLTASFSQVGQSYTVSKGAQFSQGGLIYLADTEVTLSTPGDCTANQMSAGECSASTTVAISAVESGEKYNIGAQANWSSPVRGVSASNSAAISGGTTNIVTVVQQSDIDSAKASLASSSEEDGKKALLEQIGTDAVAVESSFNAVSAQPVSSPALGEEVKEGDSPTLTATTTFTMFAVDRTQIENYVKSKIEVAEDQQVYSVGAPIFDRFLNVSNGTYTAKLKTTIYTGPKITNDEVMEKARGRKIGEVQSLLKSINGVADVKIETPYFWVSSVPDDPNKVEINITIEENK